MNQQKRRICISIVVIVLIAFLAGRVTGSYIGGAMRPTTTITANGVPIINILVMGIDARDKSANSRSDTMILAVIDPNKKNVALISIPRDTRVEIKKNTYDRINTVNLSDGPETACKMVGNLLSTKVDKYVVTNFSGFIDIIDLLDGVDIDVESRMYHYDDQVPSLTIDLQKGQQHLNGQQALAYVRYRGDPTADIGRTMRQQKFIHALANSLISTNTILKIPDLLGRIQSSLNTNLTTKDMLYLASFAASFDTADLHMQTAPGYSYTDQKTGASYWHLDEELAPHLIEKVLAGEKIETYQPTPASVYSGSKTAIDPQVQSSPPEDSGSPDDEKSPDQETDQVNQMNGNDELQPDPLEKEPSSKQPDVTNPSQKPSDLSTQSSPGEESSNQAEESSNQEPVLTIEEEPLNLELNDEQI